MSDRNRDDAMSLIAQWYVCQDCGQVGPMADFQGECRPGWTHGRLGKIEMESPALRNVKGAVEEAMREAATLLEDTGGVDGEFVNPPTAQAMREVAAELRRLAGGQ